jgi:hypothetical protein
MRTLTWYDPASIRERLGDESGNLAAEELRCPGWEWKIPDLCAVRKLTE